MILSSESVLQVGVEYKNYVHDINISKMLEIEMYPLFGINNYLHVLLDYPNFRYLNKDNCRKHAVWCTFVTFLDNTAQLNAVKLKSQPVQSDKPRKDFFGLSWYQFATNDKLNCIQGQFCSHFIFALWFEGELKSELIELYTCIRIM